jgi:peptidoglycan-associated lipoprotein
MTVFQRVAGVVTLCLVFSLGLAACGKKPAPAAPAPAPPPAAPATPPAPPPPSPPPPAPTPPAALSEEEIFARKTLEELNAERPLGNVFFDLDAATVRDDARPLLQKNAEWLKRWASTRITVEGHCDERGSSEYNLALGDRRGNAVKDYLVSLGVVGDRISVVTKGKESPFCNESTEACWQQNRRGHFVITAK